MTNEEAIEQIKILKAFTGYDENNPIVQRIQEALDMAIKALEQTELNPSYNGVKSELEQQPCEDAISRQALIEKATSWDKHFGDSERCVSLTDIQNAPSVTPSYNSIKTELKPCEDCISRQMAIDAVTKIHPVDTEYDCTLYDKLDVMYVLKDLPSVTPQTRWIPVSERLPEEDGDYILFGKVVEDEDTEYIFIGMYDACAEKFGFWEDYYDRNTLGFLDSELIEYNKVIAWMPLPQPYKEEQDGKNNTDND